MNDNQENEVRITVISRFKMTKKGFAIKDSELKISHPESDFLMNKEHPAAVRATMCTMLASVLTGGINAVIRSGGELVDHKEMIHHCHEHLQRMLAETSGELVDLYNDEE